MNSKSLEFYKIENIPGAEKYALDTGNAAFKPFRDGGNDYRYCFHQPDFLHLYQSATTGCYFCAALLYAFREPPEHWQQDAIDEETAASSRPIVLRIWQSPFEEYAWPSWSEIPEHEYILAFCGLYEIEMRRVPTPTGEFVKLSHDLEHHWEQQELFQVDGSTGSTVSIELASLWYRRCLENHHTCAVKDSRGPLPILPTRVIDVKTPGINPVLYEPGQSKAAEYVALSHCWGLTQPMRINRDTVDQEAGVSMIDREFPLPLLSDWPRSFRDAVEIVRMFNLRYLWIDNTGIIQGNAVDWARESQRMAEYFGNATFTIAATWGPSDDNGIFSSRNPLMSRPLRLIPASGSKVQPYEGLYVHLTGPSYRTDSEEAIFTPLYSRAWVLQEELLSRRLLRFGKRGIYWKCFSTNSASESNPNGTDVQPYKHNIFLHRTPMRTHLRLKDHDMTGQGHRNPYYDMWYDLVERFTTRNMKYKKDVLPAISGLAQTFDPFMDAGDAYIAGLWRADITLGLLWTADTIGYSRLILPPHFINYLTDDFAGPSWSWINCCHKSIGLRFHYKILSGGPYSYLHNQDAVGTQILRVDVTHKYPAEPFGEVQSGSLHVRAKLGTLRIDIRPYERTQRDKDKGSWVGRAPGQTHSRKLTMDNANFPSVYGVIEGDCDLDDIENRLYLQHARGGYVTAIFLPLIMHSNYGDLPSRVVGLALLPNGVQENQYVRIGRAAVDMNRWELEKCTISPREIIIV